MLTEVINVRERTRAAAPTVFETIPAVHETSPPREWLDGPERFVGAWGMSPLRELAWVNGLVQPEDPPPWESL